MSSLVHQSITNVNRRILRYIFSGHKSTVIVIATIMVQVLALKYLADAAPVVWRMEPGLVLPLVVLPGFAVLIVQLHYILAVADEYRTLAADATAALVARNPESA